MKENTDGIEKDLLRIREWLKIIELWKEEQYALLVSILKVFQHVVDVEEEESYPVLSQICCPIFILSHLSKLIMLVSIIVKK